MERYQWARIALGLNLAGTLLLAFALQIGSSDIRLVSLPNGSHAICGGNDLMFLTSPNGDAILGAHGACPSNLGQSAAIVKTEHPSLLGLGIVLIALSSAVGIFLGEGPEERENRAERRRQLKLALKKR